MEPLFEVDDKYTYELYEEYARICSKKISKINTKFAGLSIGCLVISVLLFLLGRIVFGAAFAFYALCMPILFKLIFNKSVKKAWASNKTSQNVDIHISFFETNYTMKTSMSEMTVEYEKLHKIILSETIIAVMTSRQQGICFQRSKCSDELLAFLHTVVPIEKWL